LKYFIAPFRLDGFLDLLSAVNRCAKLFAFGLPSKQSLLLNMLASENAATIVGGGLDFCRCGNTSSIVKTGRAGVDPDIFVWAESLTSTLTTEDVSVKLATSVSA
jgi:hypothetical protein